MKTITAIKAQRRARGRANVFLDGSFAFSLGIDAVAERGLATGQALSESQLSELADADLSGKCLNAALRLLSYRQRSELELKFRLKRKFDDETIEGVILKLKAKRMLDDAAFATMWREERDSFNPRSERMLRMELRRKGVDSELIDEALAGMDDEENAYRAAQRRGRALAKEDHETFRKKLGAFLNRRGFNYNVTNRTVERLWCELK